MAGCGMPGPLIEAGNEVELKLNFTCKQLGRRVQSRSFQ